MVPSLLFFAIVLFLANSFCEANHREAGKGVHHGGHNLQNQFNPLLSEGKWYKRHQIAEQMMPYIAVNTKNITGEYIPEKQFLLITASSGLANRLRVLNAFMWLAIHYYGGIQIVMVWEVNNECPGHFLDVFSPVPGIIFITEQDRPMFSSSKSCVKEYPASTAPFTFHVVYEHDMAKTQSVPDGKFIQGGGGDSNSTGGGWERIHVQEAERQMLMGLPIKKSIRDKVNAFVRTNDVCNCYSTHARMTDHNTHIHTYNYWKFINGSTCTFLMTDFPNAQKYFISEFPWSKMKYFHRLSQHYQLNDLYPVDPNDKVDDTNTMFQEQKEDTMSEDEKVIFRHEADVFQNKTMVPKRYRFTTLTNTLIDVLIAAHAQKFMGSLHSSLSELVEQYSFLARKLCTSA